MFSEQGYANVGMEDVGAAGPWWELVSAMVRGAEWLRMDLARASRPADGLRRLHKSYITFAMEDRHLVEQLPATDRQRTRQAQYEYIAESVHLMRSVHP